MKLYITVFIFLIESTVLFAQSIKIIDIDNSNYPDVGITFEFKSENSLNVNHLKIIENNKECRFTVESGAESRQTTLNCFAIDQELFADDKSKNMILEFLKSVVKNANNKELINIVTVSSEQQTQAIFKPVSIEFTSNYNQLFFRYEKLKLSKIPFEYSTEQLFNYIRKYGNLDNNYIYISRNKTQNHISEKLKKYSDSLSINYTKIKYPNTTFNIKEVLDSLKKQIKASAYVNSFEKNVKTLYFYKIIYRSEQRNKVNFFEVKYKDIVLRKFFKDKNVTIGLPDIFIYKYLSLSLLTVCIVLLYFVFKKKKIKRNDNSYTLKTQASERSENKATLIVEINEKRTKYPLDKLRTTIGRGKDNDILIANLTVSNHHATITHEGGIFYIEDNDSTNGVIVNDLKINKYQIKPNDVIRLGKATLKLSY